MKTTKKKNKKNEYVLHINYKSMEDKMGKNAPRRIGGFIEAVDNGKKTFIIDINLSSFKGQTLWGISDSVEGVSTLNWILEKDSFPQEVRDMIRSHLEERYGLEPTSSGSSDNRDSELIGDFRW